MKISFPGGVAVNAEFDGFTVKSDQPVRAGGQGAAPSPFDLFLASLGTCAGFFALRFCQQRELSTEGLELTLDVERNPETHLPSKVRIAIELPTGFPDKYRDAIIRATDQCAVKRSIADPPEFEVLTV
ncbi:OsmC family protein [Geopsychrobacter electrodiphilus]|uniref:OsmC family protein n=1 Tax=Geopsychrobacter electrodiphilus TaxID=225196 RepID=UPI00036A4F69|nr:OsmC family protein [Geopsychrobacter electrodiphilus]